MNIKARPFSAHTHYEMIASWWRAHEWPVIPREALPGFGLVMFDENNNGICAGFLYKTDSTFAILEWVVGNPVYLKKPERSEALDELIKGLIAHAKDYGYKLIFGYTKKDRLIKRYVDAGFTKTDEGMTHVIWKGV